MRDPVADAKRLLDLDGQTREQVAERVLQSEPDDHRADRRRRQQLLLEERVEMMVKSPISTTS